MHLYADMLLSAYVHANMSVPLSLARVLGSALLTVYGVLACIQRDMQSNPGSHLAEVSECGCAANEAGAPTSKPCACCMPFSMLFAIEE